MQDIMLKAKYGRVYRGVTEQTCVPFYFRQLTKKEYDTFASLHPKMDVNVPYGASEYIVNTIIVYPSIEELDKRCLAGELSGLATHAIRLSGFAEADSLVKALTVRRQMMGLISEQILAFIIAAMPTYKISDLENMGTDEIARLIAMSEHILGKEFPIASPRGPKAPIFTNKQQEEVVVSRMRAAALEAIKEVKSKDS